MQSFMNDTAPTLTIIVPTFNRARYLDSLLDTLCVQLADFPYSFEVFVGDNASPDHTPEVLEKYRERLPLRWHRHDSNVGGSANWHYLMAHSRGRYLVYVADDDALLGAELAQVITVLEELPEAAVAYAPWKLYDLVADEDRGQFYRQSEDVLVPRGDYAKLLDTVLKDGIFPEIAVYRVEALRAVMPRVSEQAFYAFVHAAEFASHGQVLFLKDPFYISITNYFADHKREQAGIGEAEYAWDRYRGGLEHVLGRAMPQLDAQQHGDFLRRIQTLIASRIAVAVRLRIQQQRDPIDTYYLAYRLKAMGGEHWLPVGLPVLAIQAAVTFLTTDPDINQGMTRLLCVGHLLDDVRRLIEQKSRLPVRFVETVAEMGELDESTLVFGLNHAVLRETLPVEFRQRFVQESDLMRKFVA